MCNCHEDVVNTGVVSFCLFETGSNNTINALLQFNFVGKLLGPRGNTFKRLQASTGTKMSILGKGSMREKEKVS